MTFASWWNFLFRTRINSFPEMCNFFASLFKAEHSFPLFYRERFYRDCYYTRGTIPANLSDAKFLISERRSWVVKLRAKFAKEVIDEKSYFKLALIERTFDPLLTITKSTWFSSSNTCLTRFFRTNLRKFSFASRDPEVTFPADEIAEKIKFSNEKL